ncbi:hypothetical protein P0Y35_06815 [Kiritimatiellaeota bacterium B1221]|nr:hypothetical protein [Kiritimatiellaeota bacterium B1221]
MSISDLYLWPLFLQFSVLVYLGWRYRKRGYHDLRSPKAHIFRCTNCHHIYIDNRRVPLSKCTKCNTLNEMIRR